jgi:hypothetical protein
MKFAPHSINGYELFSESAVFAADSIFFSPHTLRGGSLERKLHFDHRGPPPHVLAQLSEKKKAMNENTSSKKTA